MNADGSGQRNLTRNAANDYLYAAQPWSPDGRKLVFGRDRNGDGGSDDIYVINTDGSGERKLTRGRATDLVTRRAEDHLHEQARKLGRDLRHERRRQRTAAADTQPGENGQRENGQRLACLVTRAEVEAASRGTPASSSLLARAVITTASTPSEASTSSDYTDGATGRDSRAGRLGGRIPGLVRVDRFTTPGTPARSPPPRSAPVSSEAPDVPTRIRD